MILTDTGPATTEFDISSPSSIAYSARFFATALIDTPQYKAFEKASAALQQDTAAQQAMDAYQCKVDSLRPMIMLNAVEIAQQDELDRLHREFAFLPSVTVYREAQEALQALCRLTSGMISEHIGLDFAAACGASCCG